MDPYAYKRAEAFWKRDIATSHRKFCQCGDLTRHFKLTGLSGTPPSWDECIDPDPTTTEAKDAAAISDDVFTAIAEAAEVEDALDTAITVAAG